MSTPRRLTGIEWYNSNALRNFPLVDGASGLAVDGVWTLPRDLIVDLVFPVDTATHNLDAALFHISEVSVYAQGVAIGLGYNGTTIARCSINAATHTRYATYPLYGQGVYGESIGRMVVGSLDNAISSGTGRFTFTAAATRVVSTCIIPSIQGVSSISVVNASDISPAYYDDVYLISGTNVRLVVVDAHTIRIDAISGEGLNDTCDCTNDIQVKLPIKTINGVGPDPGTQNFTLLGNTCLTVTPIANGVQLQDVCSKPCCGSTELQSVTDAMNNLNNDVQAMKNLMSALQANLATVNTALATLGA